MNRRHECAFFWVYVSEVVRVTLGHIGLRDAFDSIYCPPCPPRTLYHQLGMEARARYQELHTWKCCIASGANPLCLTTNAIICNSRLLQSITAIFQWSDIDLAEVAPIFFAQLDDLDGVDGCGWCVAQLPLFRRRTSLRYLVSQFTWHQMHQVRQSSRHDDPVNPACTISSKSNWYVDSSTLNHVWEVLLFQASTDLYWRTGMQWISVTPAHSEMLQNVADLTWSDMSWKCIRNHKNGSQEIGRPNEAWQGGTTKTSIEAGRSWS